MTSAIDNSSWTRKQLTRRALLGRAGLLAGAAAASPLIAACRSGAKQNAAKPAGQTAAARRPLRGGTLTLRAATDVIVLDDAFSHDDVSNFVISNCVEPLLTVDTQAQPTGLLATSWENPDAQTYILKLRQGVTFQDGTALDAAAVEYSLNRSRNDKTAYRHSDLTAVSAIETPDPATVKISLNAPFAPFLAKLTINTGRVISPAAAAKLGQDKLKVDLTGQGTGPFTFVEWKPDDQLTLARNPNYWGRDGSGDALPYVDRLTLRPITDLTLALQSLRNREIDGFRPNSTESPAPQDLGGVQADTSLSMKTAAGLSYFYILFNEAVAPFSNKALRQAVNYAVDRAAIARDFFHGSVEPLDVVFGSSIWTADPSYHPYLSRDVARAKQLLVQAGQPNGFTFDYLISNDPTSQQLAQLIKDQLSEAGITANLKPFDGAGLLQALNASDHQAGFLGATSPTYDPDDWVYQLFSSKGSLNTRSHYRNADVDRLLDQARTTLDTTQRKPLYQQAQRQIMDDAVVCVLYLKPNFSLSTSKVQNYPIGATAAVGVSQVWKTS